MNPFVVLTGTAFSYRVIGDTPTPALIDASNDGRPHDAYQHPDTGFWRLRDEWGTELVGGRCAEHRDVTCPGAESIPNWGPHPEPESEKLYGPRQQCYDCATADGFVSGEYPELEAGVET